MKMLLSIVVVVAGLLIAALGVLLAMGSRSSAGKFAASVEVDKPASAVWPWLEEPEKQRAWISWMLESRNDPPGAVGLGTRQTWVMEDRNNNNQKMVIFGEISEYQPNKLIAVNQRSEGAYTGQSFYRLADLPNGRARVEVEMRYHFEHPVARVLEPIITPQAEKKMKDDLARLKSLVESGK